MTSCLFAVTVFSAMLLACQESAPEEYWTADTGVDAADANADARGDADLDDGGSDALDVQDGGEEDTGPDCSKDSDGDMLNNCDESELCTDPTNADTDEDGLNDFEELKEGIDPCDPDTDDDGVDDPAEFKFGLNPNDPETFDDGVLDENRWRVGACDPPAGPSRKVTELVDYFTSQAGNYKFGIPQDFDQFEHVGLAGVQPPVAASIFGESAHSLYGFVLSKNAEDGRTDPTPSLVETVRPEIIEIAGNNEDNLLIDVQAGAFHTHDLHRTTLGLFKIKTPTAKTPAKVREELLLGIDAFSQSDVSSGLPSTAGESYTTFRIKLELIQRRKSSGPNQVLVSGSVVPETIYADNSDVQFDVDGLTFSAHIGEADSSVQVGCMSFEPIPEYLKPLPGVPGVPIPGSLRLLLESDQDPTTATVVPRGRDDGYNHLLRDNRLTISSNYLETMSTEFADDFAVLRYEYLASP